MKRPNDRTEHLRRAVAAGVLKMNLLERKTLQRQLKCGDGRIPKEEVGWILAFKTYPWSLHFIGPEGPYDIYDVEMTDIMSNGQRTSDNGLSQPSSTSTQGRLDDFPEYVLQWGPSSFEMPRAAWLDSKLVNLIDRIGDEFVPEVILDAVAYTEQGLLAASKARTVIGALVKLVSAIKLPQILGKYGELSANEIIASGKTMRAFQGDEVNDIGIAIGRVVEERLVRYQSTVGHFDPSLPLSRLLTSDDSD